MTRNKGRFFLVVFMRNKNKTKLASTDKEKRNNKHIQLGGRTLAS